MNCSPNQKEVLHLSIEIFDCTTSFTISMVKHSKKMLHPKKVLIYFIFVTYKILQATKGESMTRFNGITNSDHRGLWIYTQQDDIVNKTHSTSTSSFQRKINSTSPYSIKKYKKYMKNKIETNQYNITFSSLLDIANKRRLSSKVEQGLNSIDAIITNIILKAGKGIIGHQHT